MCLDIFRLEFANDVSLAFTKIKASCGSFRPYLNPYRIGVRVRVKLITLRLLWFKNFFPAFEGMI